MSSCCNLVAMSLNGIGFYTVQEVMESFKMLPTQQDTVFTHARAQECMETGVQSSLDATMERGATGSYSKQRIAWSLCCCKMSAVVNGKQRRPHYQLMVQR